MGTAAPLQSPGPNASLLANTAGSALPPWSLEGAQGLVAAWKGMRWWTACGQKAVLRATAATAGKPGAPAGSADPAAAAWGGAWRGSRDSRGPGRVTGVGAGVVRRSGRTLTPPKGSPPHDQGAWLAPESWLRPGDTPPPHPRPVVKSSPPAPGSGLLSRRATKEPPAMRSHIQIRTLSRRKSAKGPDSWTAHCSPPPSFPSEMDNGQSASG